MKIRLMSGACGALLILALISACGSGGDAGAEAAATSGAAVAGAKVGNLAPDFELARVGGGTIKLSELRGQAVIIDFWDTWCPPCRRALPHLQELHDEYAGRLTVVGIAFGRDGVAAVDKFLTKGNLTFPCAIMDDKFDTARAYGGIQSIPTTFLVDDQGVIRKIWQGGYDKQVYESALQSVLGI